jgi:hypothetical protein
MTLIELIYHAIADPKRTLLLIAIVCCTLVSTWPVIIFIALMAMKLSTLKLIYAAFASTFCSGSFVTFMVIKVKKMRKSLKNDPADGGQLTKGNSRRQNPKPAQRRRKPRPPR